MRYRILFFLFIFLTFSSCISIDSLEPPKGNSCLLIYTEVSVKDSATINNRIDFCDRDLLLFSILPNKKITIYRNCSPGSISISSYRVSSLLRPSTFREEKFKYNFYLAPDIIAILPFKIVVKSTEYSSMAGFDIGTLTFDEYDKCIEYLNNTKNIDKWKIRKLKLN